MNDLEPINFTLPKCLTEKVRPAADEEDFVILAANLLGINANEDNAYDKVMSGLNKKYGISFMDFINLTFDLLQFCDLAGVPFTGKQYRGFADIKNKEWILKIEA